MNFYAHTQGPDKADWEPLFTPFGETTDDPTAFCSGQNAKHCAHCENLNPQHGHLNKVAHLAENFAAEMFPEGPDRDSAKQWGYLAGLWHDLGKFAPAWQDYLSSKSDPHTADTTGKLDHSTAGAQQATKAHPVLGHILGYPIAGHHSGLLDARSNHACQFTRLQKDDLPDYSNAPEALTSLPVPESASISTAG